MVSNNQDLGPDRHRLVLVVDRWLHDRISEEAKKDRRSINGWLNIRLLDMIGRMGREGNDET